MNLKEKTMKNKNFKRNKMTMKEVKKQVQGITLIALVVTIIVLLILAGVAISLTIGQNGIFARAQNAVNVYKEATANEQSELGKAEDIMDEYLNGNGGTQGGGSETGENYNTGTTVEEAKEQNKPFENDTTITDSCTPANSIRVPAGFKIAQDSATTVEDGIVIEDKDGNQFVWVPAKTEEKGGATINLSAGGTATIVYQIQDFTSDNVAVEMLSDEGISVNRWGGYYIGRFEAGDQEVTNAKMMRKNYITNQLLKYAEENNIDITNSDTLTEEQEQQLNEKANEIENEIHTITIKSGQAPYNYITQEKARAIAEEMSTLQSYSTVKTKLISSYAWDTAIDFIQKTNSDNEHSDYATNTPEGNYLDTTFNYTDIEGNTNQIKEKEDGVLVPTGQTTAVNNIYDMGGNLREYTIEKSPIQSYAAIFHPYINCGGDFEGRSNRYPAGNRNRYSDGSIGNESSGFRIALYLN